LYISETDLSLQPVDLAVTSEDGYGSNSNLNEPIKETEIEPPSGEPINEPATLHLQPEEDQLKGDQSASHMKLPWIIGDTDTNLSHAGSAESEKKFGHHQDNAHLTVPWASHDQKHSDGGFQPGLFYIGKIFLFVLFFVSHS